MAIIDYFPFTAGRTLTIAQWNELFNAIRDGSFFLNTAPIASLINNLATRVAVLEQTVAFLSQIKGRAWIKHQAVMTAAQNQVTLAHPPIIDSEMVHLNGVYLSRTKVDINFEGDYTLDGAVITLHPEVAIEVGAGDMLLVSYQYEVEGHA